MQIISLSYCGSFRLGEGEKSLLPGQMAKDRRLQLVRAGIYPAILFGRN